MVSRVRSTEGVGGDRGRRGCCFLVSSLIHCVSLNYSTRQLPGLHTEKLCLVGALCTVSVDWERCLVEGVIVDGGRPVLSESRNTGSNPTDGGSNKSDI